MKRVVLTVFCICAVIGVLSAQNALLPKTVSQRVENAASTDEAISVLRSALAATPAPSVKDRMQLLSVLASLLEQTGQYQEARHQYSLAANASASVNNAAGRGAVASPEYLLGAVRCALSTGDTITADYVLSTAFFDIQNTEVIAQVKLYAVWSWLCKIESDSEISQPVTALKSFLPLDSMKSVRPSVLLTLWYITGSKEYAEILQKEYASSTECAIVQGNAQVMPNTFWYFLPSRAKESGTTVQSTVQQEKSVPESTESTVVVRWQLGFYKQRENAQDLVNRVQKAGFSAQINEEKRPSGTIYFSVTVNENKDGTMGQNLKDAGFECYPVY